jgi:hypothetical protein
MTDNSSSTFIETMKESNIKTNQASIGVHKQNIVDNFEYMTNSGAQFLPSLKKCLTELDAIPEDNINTNIIQPTIGISTALYILFDSPIESDKSIIQTYRRQLKSSLLSVLEIAKHTKDQRITDYSKKAAEGFAKINN